MITSVDHISIQASDFERALTFYSELLGFHICVAPFDFKTRRLCYLDAGNIRIELYSTKEGESHNALYSSERVGLDHIAFVTRDLRGLVHRLSCHGVRIIKPPFSISTNAGHSTLAFVEGPDGQEIELRQEQR